MITNETQTLFSMIGILEKVRDLFRLTAPTHVLDSEQKAELMEYLDNLKAKIQVLERITK
jgi:hypothetical protein